jgi:membrane-bound serine protease (ClpP class)
MTLQSSPLCGLTSFVSCLSFSNSLVFNMTGSKNSQLLLGLTLCVSMIVAVGRLSAQEGKAPGPDGQFLTLTSPIDGEDYALVSRWALKLQDQARREQRPMFLVLQIPDGASQFHQVYGLADFLTGQDIPDVTVVAWLPESVTGHNAILALAAHEIVIAPDAEMGNIGRGKSVSTDKREQVRQLIRRGRNPLANDSIVEAMMNPAADLQQATVIVGEGAEESREVRFLNSDEIRKLQDEGMMVPSVNEVKPAGSEGSFSGRRMKQLGMLISQTEVSRNGVQTRYGLPREALLEPENQEQGKESVARLVKLEGPIDWGTEFHLTRQIDRAIAQGADTLVVEITSPGGMLGPSHNLAEKLANLTDEGIRTIAYVPQEAISGGGLIAFGCDEIYLHPDAFIGDIGPIEMREGGQFQHADEKIVSMLREIVNSLAQKKGRPPALLMSMVDRNLPVYRVIDSETGRVWYASENEIEQPGNQWVKQEMVEGTQEGLFLTLDGKRAATMLIAESPVDSYDDFKQRVGIPLDDNVLQMKVNWNDRLIGVLNTRGAMFLLVVAAMGFFYLELNLPTGFFGVLSALCFVLFFWSRFLSGAAGWLEVILFTLGIICIMIEVFVIPGLGVMGIAGTGLVITALVMASQTFSGLDPGNVNNVMKTLGTLFGAGVTVIVFAVFMSNLIPRLPFVRSMIHAPTIHDTHDDPEAPRLKPDSYRDGAFAGLMGEQGKAVTLLKPYGKAKIAGQVLDVVSQGTMIDSGALVEVIEVTGQKIKVREVS